MFAYGVCVGPSGKFDTIAKPSLARWAPGGRLLLRYAQRSIYQAYNDLISEARTLPGLEGLILLHDDVELQGDLEQPLRTMFQDPAVAIVGVVGGVGGEFEWWGQPVALRRGRVVDTYGNSDFGGGTHDVDGVDGLLLALSPWAVEHLSLNGRWSPPFHGYDAELCAAARAAGRKVCVTELPVVHRCSTGTNWTAFERARYAHLLRWKRSDLRTRLRWRRYVLQLRARELIGR